MHMGTKLLPIITIYTNIIKKWFNDNHDIHEYKNGFISDKCYNISKKNININKRLKTVVWINLIP